MDRSSILQENPSKYEYKEEEIVQSIQSNNILYRCSICGYIYDGDDFTKEPDTYVCPLCNVPKDSFEIVEAKDEKQKEITQKQWVCTICGYIYDGENFDKEPDTYVCPICTVP